MTDTEKDTFRRLDSVIGGILITLLNSNATHPGNETVH